MHWVANRIATKDLILQSRPTSEGPKKIGSGAQSIRTGDIVLRPFVISSGTVLGVLKLGVNGKFALLQWFEGYMSPSAKACDTTSPLDSGREMDWYCTTCSDMLLVPGAYEQNSQGPLRNDRSNKHSSDVASELISTRSCVLIFSFVSASARADEGGWLVPGKMRAPCCSVESQNVL